MVFDLEFVDIGGAVEGAFDVNFVVGGFAEFEDLVHPDSPIDAVKMVEGLDLHCVTEEIDANFQNHAVFDYGIESLLWNQLLTPQAAALLLHTSHPDSILAS